MSETPGLSVVIIGRNEGVRLHRCIRSVHTMVRPDLEIEIIYVDSASIDNSVRVARALGADAIVVDPVRPTAAIGRNAGWRKARSPLILFLDGDTILAPRFVIDSLPEFENRRVAAVWGHRRELDTKSSIYNRVLDLDWISPPGVVDYCGGDVLIRRDVLEQVSGYDETLIAGEEPEMCRRIRARDFVILHADRAMTQHDLGIRTFRQYWKRATRTGYAYAEVSRRFQATSMPLWTRESLANRNRAVALSSLTGVALLTSVVALSFVPVSIMLGFLLMLSVRTAVKNEWKKSGFTTRLLYGAHSHFQQIPIYTGQLRFAWDKRMKRQRNLIEYKQPGVPSVRA